MTHEYIYYHNHIIVINGNTIIDIIDVHNYKSRNRLAVTGTKFIKNKILPEKIIDDERIFRYSSIDILKKANNLINTNENGTGEYKYYYKNGNLKEEYYWVNCKKEGIYKKYFIDGTIQIECYYVNNSLHGIYKEYKNCIQQNISDEDRLIKIYNYNMNKLTGKCIKYTHPNKNYYEEYNYVDNIKNGEYKILSPDNSIFGKYEKGYIIDKIVLDEYNNILYQENKINDKHILVTVFVNNKLFEKYEKKITTNEKNGYYKKYFETINEQIQIESNFKDDLLHGTYKEYFTNGKIKTECEHEDNHLINTCITYHQNGMIESEIFYKKGIEKFKKMYNTNGKLIEYYLKDDSSYYYLIYFKSYTNNNIIYDEFIKELK
jgi:antitoxin component YwqK of YwqJK toxin-antitoxin module